MAAYVLGGLLAGVLAVVFADFLVKEIFVYPNEKDEEPEFSGTFFEFVKWLFTKGG